MSEPTAAERWNRFVEFQDRDRPHREAEAKLIADHGPSCYGSYGKCISCGCNPPVACVSHRGSPAHQAELLERLIQALEAKI